MLLLHRQMRPQDVDACVKGMAHDEVVAPRYGDAIDQLPLALLGLLGAEAVRAYAFEFAEEGRLSLVGFGISVFVNDAFAQFLTTPPFVWAGPELVHRVLHGSSPVLSDADLRQHNVNGGLNLLMWVTWVQAEYKARLEVMSGMMSVFVELHRGFQLRQIISQSEVPETVMTTLSAGGMILTSEGKHTSTLTMPASEFITTPHCLHITRDLVPPASWISSLFVYQSPQIFFSPSEQRLLIAAMAGQTDDELSVDLGISLSGVKKTWRILYERVGTQLPALIPNQATDSLEGERGKGKKQRLLAYLREHPEELRPLPRKPARQEGVQ